MTTLFQTDPPPSFLVIRHVRPKLSCARCACVLQAPAPTRPVDRGMAGPGLLAHVVTAKFSDHLPFYRQSQIYTREGVDLDRSTLAKWVAEASHLLAPLNEALRRYVMKTDKLHGDDTPLPVLAPGTGKTKTGRFWTYVRDGRPAGDNTPPAMWFTYSPDRRGEHPQQHLAKFRGILQADAYAGFNKLYENGAIQEAPCMAHIRRKFYDLMEAHQSPIATEAVERIRAVYRIGREIRGRPPEERRQVRNARPVRCLSPCIAGSKHCCRNCLASQTLQQPSAMHSRSGPRCCATATMAASNWTTRRPSGSRAVVVGQRNYLFAGSDRGAERAAVFYSLIGSAKLLGLDPEVYLRYVLNRVANHPIQPHRGVAAVARRAKPGNSKHRRGLNPQPEQSSIVDPVALPHIVEFLDYGQITLGELYPVGCVAIAADEHHSLAMLRRREGETLAQLLSRLD